MKQLTKLLAMLFSVAILLSACGDDDDDDMKGNGTTIDISDPIAIASEITVENATTVDGNPPAPSTDPDAPSIDDDAGDLITTQGGLLLIDVDLNSGDVAGTYVQIVGSDSYFDVPFNPNGRTLKRGRVFQDSAEPVIEIDIPDNLGIGKFCAEICVYDAEARVSNIVERCVEITELGGENSEFLTANTWKATKFKEIDESGEIEEYEVGQLIKDTFVVDLQCQDGSFKDVEITETERTDLIEVTFSENGSVSVTIIEFESYLDFGQSTCENQVFDEFEFEATFKGTWSYDNESKELIIVLSEVVSTNDPEADEDLEVAEFKVEFDESTTTLILTQNFGGESESIYFEPKK